MNTRPALSRLFGTRPAESADPANTIYIHHDRRADGTAVAITHLHFDEVVGTDEIHYAPDAYAQAGLAATDSYRLNSCKLGIVLAINYLRTKQAGISDVMFVVDNEALASYANHQLLDDLAAGFPNHDAMTRRVWEVFAEERSRRDLRIREQEDRDADRSANIHFINRLQAPAHGDPSPALAPASRPEAVIVPLRPAAPMSSEIPAAAPSHDMAASMDDLSSDWKEADDWSAPAREEPTPAATPSSAAADVAAADDADTDAGPDTFVPLIEPVSHLLSSIEAAAESAHDHAGAAAKTHEIVIEPQENTMNAHAYPVSSRNDNPPASGATSDVVRKAPQQTEVTHAVLGLMVRLAKEMRQDGAFQVDMQKQIEWDALIAHADGHLAGVRRLPA